MKIWMNVAESAEYAGVSRDTIYTACERNELRHARIGGRRAIRIKAEWIDVNDGLPLYGAPGKDPLVPINTQKRDN